MWCVCMCIYVCCPALQKRLTQINAAIQRKEASREEYDKTIVETQAAYMKVRY